MNSNNTDRMIAEDKLTALMSASAITARGGFAWVNCFATLGEYKGIRLCVDTDNGTAEAFICAGEWHNVSSLPRFARGYVQQ